MTEHLHITLMQTNIVWENKQENLRCIRQQLELLDGTTEIVVLPEMCTTGFSMQTKRLAESMQGETLSILKQWSKELKVVLVGSIIVHQESSADQPDAYYNRAFFITPQGENFYYDKRHLFRMGQESQFFTPGTKRHVIHYKGWKILLLICYDLRFPVWSRNVSNEYDLIIYVANWPASRRKAWDILLQARALENECYVCGVNRVGMDGNHLNYDGGSMVVSPKGELLVKLTDNMQHTVTTTLSLAALQEFRQKFPAWKDADNFQLNIP